jgi:hypothetical protein
MVAWRIVFVLEFDYFLQQKLMIIVLKLQSHDWGWEISRRLGLKLNNNIYNVRHNLGFTMVFSDSHVNNDDLIFLNQLRGVNEGFNGDKIIFKHYKHVGFIQYNIIIKMSGIRGW